MSQLIRNFMNQESAGGILLMIAVALALVLANSPLAGLYNGFIETEIQVRIGHLDIDKPALLWINDGLMALFFLLIGLEVKRELLEGALSSPAKAALPTFAAIGGMLAPAAVYLMFNYGTDTQVGWAIPAATDIAFALGVLALLGNRVPVALKVFLLALAIIDDLGVIVIIALFYTSELSMVSLMIAAVALSGLFYLNRRRVASLTPYLLLGLVLWTAVLKSGVHATLAGVALAFLIPLRVGKASPAETLEHKLHPWSTFLILPVFAFANAGVNLGNLSLDALMSPVPVGIILGLVIGKPLGIMLTSWIAVRMGWAQLPQGITWNHIAPVGLMCGIGFTMAMFIASLAFEHGGMQYGDTARMGILIGSAIAAIVGYFWLAAVTKQPVQQAEVTS
ncbi:Na+/H+ antiporter NhaA [Paraferrimonas sedimenticola]|uniref:Na(+)/H(+) antiporter NhaA n=1 Tax=Paraferrimonas sedimenticola TaxID=375674 RepID=A0AA37RXW7_9GAMM|nr:Na+/H+ antiporter NhaA [Paraferrimonas sedimenticola]GLP97200.1 Na(+)/H(+) antiporter NhaA [Paraferrimonas sedimenticola]